MVAGHRFEGGGQAKERRFVERSTQELELDEAIAIGNSYGIRLTRPHAKFPQPELGPWVEGSPSVGEDWKPPVLEGWEPPEH